MVFEWHDEGKLHRVPKLEPGPPNVWFGDIYGSAENAENPLTGSFFYLEKMANPDPVPTYTYDEAGVVLKGELHMKDEKGNTAKLLPGDTFFIHRGSTITFDTPRYAVAFKTASRPKTGSVSLSRL